jgi:hypothetical protein
MNSSKKDCKDFMWTGSISRREHIMLRSEIDLQLR